ncbi:arylamine N-acetyltransferase [Streptomyces sp. NPDC001941]|uniref:arylamine N-acetyltransferase family protein n=1 Tax=Streptomyces sp. NPDC001941 TaxID=3154659 RepID=UPI00331F1520
MTGLALDGYLRRLGCTARPAPTLPFLKAVCRAHVLAVPFETLDFTRGARPGLDLYDVYVKVVERGRGGCSLELNRLLGHFLVRVGFGVRYVSAQVWQPDLRAWSELAEHVVLHVSLDGRAYFVDVAHFGVTSHTPFALDASRHWQDDWLFTRSRDDDGVPVLLRGTQDTAPRPLFRLVLPSPTREHHERVADHHARSEFGRSLLCGRTHPDGGHTLVRGDRVFRSRDGVQTSARITSGSQLPAVLDEVLHGHPQLVQRARFLWHTRPVRESPPGPPG